MASTRSCGSGPGRSSASDALVSRFRSFRSFDATRKATRQIHGTTSRMEDSDASATRERFGDRLARNIRLARVGEDGVVEAIAFIAVGLFDVGARSHLGPLCHAILSVRRPECFTSPSRFFSGREASAHPSRVRIHSQVGQSDRRLSRALNLRLLRLIRGPTTRIRADVPLYICA